MRQSQGTRQKRRGEEDRENETEEEETGAKLANSIII